MHCACVCVDIVIIVSEFSASVVASNSQRKFRALLLKRKEKKGFLFGGDYMDGGVKFGMVGCVMIINNDDDNACWCV